MRLRTIGLISTLVLGLLAGPLPAEAQKAGMVYRMGFLRYSCSSLTTNQSYIAFRQGLRELGYVEGQNLVIDHRCGGRKREGLTEVAAELVRLKVDVIVTSPGRPAIRAAQRATRTIPIVMPGANVDPVKAGFVVSLARPGGNITGLANLDTKLHAKRLELLKEAFPRISRVAILWTQRQQKHELKNLKVAGQALGIQIRSVVARSSDHLNVVLSAISQEHPDGLLVAPNRPTVDHRARIIDFAAKRRLPTIYYWSQFVDAGGLMSYGADRQHLLRRAATYVDKILKGAKPADLPVERPTVFELIINLKTAKKLGLTIPPEILMRADRVIK
jgi:putative ABC transport system substrate-binding protein